MKTHNYPGVFITFEGCEGSGKTTQATLYKECLEQKGYKVLLTKEPGGTPVGNIIRAILLSEETINLSAIAEVLLYEADRAQHVDNVIIPALEQSFVVISDRYIDSTTSYQAAGRNLSDRDISRLNEFATEGLLPDVTVFLDIPIAIGLDRSEKRLVQEHLDEGRFEHEDLAFHERVYDAYSRLEKTYFERFVRVNGLGHVNTIQENIQKCINYKFPELFLHVIV